MNAEIRPGIASGSTIWSDLPAARAVDQRTLLELERNGFEQPISNQVENESGWSDRSDQRERVSNSPYWKTTVESGMNRIEGGMRAGEEDRAADPLRALAAQPHDRIGRVARWR